LEPILVEVDEEVQQRCGAVQHRNDRSSGKLEVLGGIPDLERLNRREPGLEQVDVQVDLDAVDLQGDRLDYFGGCEVSKDWRPRVIRLQDRQSIAGPVDLMGREPQVNIG
jgi:hypothetical protein